MRNPGDKFMLDICGEREPVECIVMEVHPEDGRITKAKAVENDDRLLRLGFFVEGDHYVIFELDIVTRN